VEAAADTAVVLMDTLVVVVGVATAMGMFANRLKSLNTY